MSSSLNWPKGAEKQAGACKIKRRKTGLKRYYPIRMGKPSPRCSLEPRFSSHSFSNVKLAQKEEDLKLLQSIKAWKDKENKADFTVRS